MANVFSSAIVVWWVVNSVFAGIVRLLEKISEYIEPVARTFKSR